MKIIKIQFGSPKVYTYLLDFKVKEVPKKGDILKHIAGATEKGPYYDNVKVIDVQEVDALPEIVTSVVRIWGKHRQCDFCKLKTETINKLRASPGKKHIAKKATTSTTLTPELARLVEIGTEAFCSTWNTLMFKRRHKT